MTRQRLDSELVRRGEARSREQARELVEAGRVKVNGAVAMKPATQVERASAIVVEPADDVEARHYVSRGAHKLLGALDAFPEVDVAGRDCLDAGASTGGFTQVLLERGGARVIGVDVGYGQLAWSLRTDERVVTLERTNVRTLTASDLPWRPSLIVSDLSFIPLELVMPALAGVIERPGDLLLMVKPQFEVGRERVGDGVVRDPALRFEAVLGVAHSAIENGLHVMGVAASPLPGPSGNVEYFLWLSARDRDAGSDTIGSSLLGSSLLGSSLMGDELDHAVRRAIAEGPA